MKQRIPTKHSMSQNPLKLSDNGQYKVSNNHATIEILGDIQDSSSKDDRIHSSIQIKHGNIHSDMRRSKQNRYNRCFRNGKQNEYEGRRRRKRSNSIGPSYEHLDWRFGRMDQCGEIRQNRQKPPKRRQRRSRSFDLSDQSLSHLSRSIRSYYSSRWKNDRSISKDSYHSKRDDIEGTYYGRPGDYIDCRYRVLRTLGNGTFGRVVQCSERGHGSLKAIKVVRSVKKYVDEARIEATILNSIQKELSRSHSVVARKSGSRIVHLYDYFSWNSHYCLVLEPLGISLYEYVKKTNYRPWIPSDVATITVDLISALACLHLECHCVHTDLKLENVLFEKEFNLRSRNDRPDSYRVKLIDFGGAVFIENEKPSTGIINTRQYRSPEVLLMQEWSYPSDVWSAGCIVAELFTGELLFQTRNDMHHIALIEAVVGSFPKEMKKSSNLFSSSGRVRWPPKYDSQDFSTQNIQTVYRQLPLKSLVQEQFDLRGHSFGGVSNERDDLLFFLQSCLKINPKERTTAYDALKLPFLTNYSSQ